MPWSQEPSTGHCRNWDDSNQHPLILRPLKFFLKLVSVYTYVSQVVSFHYDAVHKQNEIIVCKGTQCPLNFIALYFE
jgi:hypothetical protein